MKPYIVITEFFLNHVIYAFAKNKFQVRFKKIATKIKAKAV